MAELPNDHIINIHLSEYEKLKQEQIQRLGFRDNLIYANLIAITGIVSVVVENSARMPILLVLPMVCLVLGWTYLVNDQKISAIGQYIRTTFSDKIRTLINDKNAEIFGWEVAHRSDKRRGSRKILQFIIDEFVFISPGVIALIMFWLDTTSRLPILRWVSGAELLFILILGWQIFSYADFKIGK